MPASLLSILTSFPTVFPLQAVGPDTTPFLISSVFPSPFAAAATPAGEAIRVRTLGALGWLGRRKNVGVEENKVRLDFCSSASFSCTVPSRGGSQMY
jgi:hypothetical protein